MTPHGDRSMSTLVQVMACCLTAPSHYLNQCWIIISGVKWRSSEVNLIWIAEKSNSWSEFKICSFKIIPISPRAQWVNKEIDHALMGPCCIWVLSRGQCVQVYKVWVLCSMKQKGSHVNYFVVTGCTWGGHGDQLKCSQGLQNSQHDCHSVSVVDQRVVWLTFGPKPSPEVMVIYKYDPKHQGL